MTSFLKKKHVGPSYWWHLLWKKHVDPSLRCYNMVFAEGHVTFCSKILCDWRNISQILADSPVVWLCPLWYTWDQNCAVWMILSSDLLVTSCCEWVPIKISTRTGPKGAHVAEPLTRRHKWPLKEKTQRWRKCNNLRMIFSASIFTDILDRFKKRSKEPNIQP